MIFKRRERPHFLDRAREFLYPRKGFWRGFGYISKRMRRLPDSPHRIALGFACGAFASFTPFFTLHFILAALIAWILRANIVASLFGTVVGNPVTFPAIATTALWLGRLITGAHDEGSDFNAVMEGFGAAFTALWDGVLSLFGGAPADFTGLGLFFRDVFMPYMLGGSVLGLVAGFVTYWVLGPLITAYQERRQRRFEQRVAELQRASDREQRAYAVQDTGEGDNA
jgi:hypothetical protein